MSKKLKPKITSPGEAWMNFVNSKEGHNAAAVTPEYLKPADKSLEDPFYHEKVSKLKQMASQYNSSQPNQVVKAINKKLPTR